MESFSAGSIASLLVLAVVPLLLSLGAVLLFKLRTLQSTLLVALGVCALFALFLHDWTREGGGIKSLIRSGLIYLIVAAVLGLALRKRWKKATT